MADYQLNGQGQYINYMQPGVDGFQNFLKGGNDANGNPYPKVEMSLWDQATMCGTCHVGGVFYEEDRMGTRLPARTLADWGPAFTGAAPNLNPITATVWENYSTTGKDKSFVAMSPWVYPVYMGMGGAPDPNLPDGGPMIVPYGWAPKDMTMANNNGGAPYTVKAGQLMMPNVKEMDCLFCHLKGYDNVMTSVMVQAGSLSAAPTTGAGLFDMFSLSPTYMGYDPRNGKSAFYRIGAGNLPPAFASYSSHEVVFLTAAVTENIKGKPDENNCHQCHASKTLKNFPEMFGVTGTSTGFLSSAPMVYDPANGVGPLGKKMVNYDINSPLMQSGASPVLTGNNVQNFMMAGLNYPQASGPSGYNTLDASKGEIGGGNPAMTGPLFYSTMDGKPVDQNTLKKSTMPFPRAEWFKRGDAWQAGQDVHGSFGCAGCHFTGNSTDKNQCDPARGFDAASTIQDGLPAIKERQPVLEQGETLDAAIKKHDTRNTMKRCEFCHVTGTDYNGNPIETYGAPNPNLAHANAGLLANLTQIVDKVGLHGDFGGKGVPRESNFTTQEKGAVDGVQKPGGTILGRGNHLDVMDCTVCHVDKVSMAVRSLDATSGMRFPAIVGTDPMKGMLGLFEDPTGMGAAATGMGGELKHWTPVVMWQPYGNMEGTLSWANKPADQRFQFRRKLYLTNPISAILFNNEGSTVDANGDGVTGGMLIGDDEATGLPTASTKPSLKGYRDVFTGDVPNKNNTSGFELPIFDPWAMRELKSGFNFVPAPLSVIGAGFGGFGTPAGKTDPTNGAFASLYGPNGMFSNDNWKYASVWSGAVVFTEPDQIRGYKQYRTAIKDATDGKSWMNTSLTMVGAPFMVTHGVKPTDSYVKGKSCADCHAAGKGFFKGSFDMVGPAIPSTKSYDPSTYPMTDANGNLVVDTATGEPVRGPAQGWTIPGDQGNMMMRPLEPIRIKAYKGDLRGYFESYNKLGQPREVNFVHDVNVGGVDYSYASTIDRSEIAYPAEDGAIYYKVGQVNADGSVNGGAQPLTGAAYATYLETEISPVLADYGIGIDPVATINPIADASATDLGVQVKQNADVALSAAPAQMNAGSEVGSATYAWTTSDGTAVTNAGSRTGATVKFTTLGTKTITLKVTDEEGKVSQTSTNVDVILAPVTIGWNGTTDVATFTTFPIGTASVKIAWGDGFSTTKSGTALTDPLTVRHLYSTGTAKTIKFYCYNGTGAQIGYQQATILP
ncbi:PKD domain-containing protein [Geomonas subterranea]|uniref:PKD domain-containing protein n=1 Tax=Geomonas subterranea TaxID=2847989 RepID=UPI001CD5AAA6|nr:PKD domain-containing protein [Geomonas fuzhouensis]